MTAISESNRTQANATVAHVQLSIGPEDFGVKATQRNGAARNRRNFKSELGVDGNSGPAQGTHVSDGAS